MTNTNSSTANLTDLTIDELKTALRSFPNTHLQSIGAYAAMKAEELRVGDTMVWNWGGTSEVVKIERASKCFLRIHEKSDGKVYQRRVKLGRLVACERALASYRTIKAELQSRNS